MLKWLLAVSLVLNVALIGWVIRRNPHPAPSGVLAQSSYQGPDSSSSELNNVGTATTPVPSGSAMGPALASGKPAVVANKPGGAGTSGEASAAEKSTGLAVPTEALAKAAIEKSRADANEWIQQGRTDKAVEVLKTALAKNPESPEINMDLGITYAHALHDPKMAADYFKKSLENEPANGKAIQELAQITATEADPSAGRAFLESIAKANPNLEAAQLGLADLAIARRGREKGPGGDEYLRTAEDHLRKAMEIPNNEGEAHKRLSQLYAETNRPREAVEVQKALVMQREKEAQDGAVDPQIARARQADAEVDLAHLLMKTGDARGADNYLRDLSKRFPDDPRIKTLRLQLKSAE
jgi:tetratricopeptide (TPR) repeat protein